MSEALYHLVPADAWEAFVASGEQEWRPASLASEGFVHLSFGHQVEGTLAVHFAGAERLVLLALDPARLRDALVVEASRDGAPFPHLYRALRRSDVLEARPLVRAGPRWEGLP